VLVILVLSLDATKAVCFLFNIIFAFFYKAQSAA